MRYGTVALLLALFLGIEPTNAQELEAGEWRMFGAPVPRSSDTTRRFLSVWVGPVWLYNTQTGTVYRVIGYPDSGSYGCKEDDNEAPCTDEGMVPVPLVEGETLSVVAEPGLQAGGWRMFARDASVGQDTDQDIHQGAWLYNEYSGAAYYVHARCVDYIAGCMTAVSVRDAYNQPAALNPYASGLIQ